MEPRFTSPPEHESTAAAARSLAGHRHDESRYCAECNHVGLIFTEDLSEWEGGWYTTTYCRCAVAENERATLDAAGVPEVYQEATLDNWHNTGRTPSEKTTNAGTLSRARRIVGALKEARADGINLWLYGTGGTGKTWIACAIAVAAARAGFSIRFISAASLVREAIEHKENFDGLFHADFLVVDGVEDLPETRFGYEMTLVLDLLRHRSHNSQPTIFTSDKPTGALPERLGRVLTSLLQGRTIESKLEGVAFERTSLTEKWS